METDDGSQVSGSSLLVGKGKAGRRDVQIKPVDSSSAVGLWLGFGQQDPSIFSALRAEHIMGDKEQLL